MGLSGLKMGGVRFSKELRFEFKSTTCTCILIFQFFKMSMSDSELACCYAALLLADDDVPITAEKIVTILKAAKVDFEPFWPGLFAKCLETLSIKDLITNIGSGAGPAQAAPAGGDAAPTGGDAAPAKEEKKEEPEEESDDDMGFGLFD